MSIPSQSTTSYHFGDTFDAQTTQQFFTSFPVCQHYTTHQSSFLYVQVSACLLFSLPMSRCHTSKHFEHRPCKSFLSASVKHLLWLKEGEVTEISPCTFHSHPGSLLCSTTCLNHVT